MQFYFSKNSAPYIIHQPEVIHTPRLIVFQDRVKNNIERMRYLLKSIDPTLDLQNLCPHVKTHKSSAITKMVMDEGVSFFKASLNEIDMLARCRVPRIFVAYPLLKQDAERVAQYILDYPHIQFFVQLSRHEHVEILTNISREKNITWHYYVDANVGMNRTGLPVEEVFDFYLSHADQPFLSFAGLHAYDGHIHHKMPEERSAASIESMSRLKKCLDQFAGHGVHVENCIVAGTPGFVPDVEYWFQNRVDTDIYYSPGTWIYFDTVSNEMMPNTFEYAAVILTQVIDKPTSHTATLNVGHKRWAVDQGPVETFSVPGMSVVSKSEEHTVVTAPEHITIGDYILIVPRHVCSTVNLWEYAVIINKHGEIVGQSPVDGRNR